MFEVFLEVPATTFVAVKPDVLQNFSYKLSCPKGIPNIGNSCYINSTIQALIGNQAIKKLIMNPEWPKADAKDFQKALQEFVGHLDKSQDSKNLKKYALNFRDAVFKCPPFAGQELTAPQDAAELATLILDHIGYKFSYNITREVPEKKLHEVYESVTNILQIEIAKKKPIVQTLIDDHFKTKSIDDNWRGEHKYKETIRLGKKPPEQIVLQFMRFMPGEQFGTYTKIEDSLILPKDNILDFTNAFETQKNKVCYKVTGAVHHAGNCMSGHYCAYTLQEGVWYQANDATISEACTISKKLATSYILILEKI